jgi:hypothetical protein
MDSPPMENTAGGGTVDLLIAGLRTDQIDPRYSPGHLTSHIPTFNWPGSSHVEKG